eukprot:353040-Chlamydomonas_euryale.AAC.5
MHLSPSGPESRPTLRRPATPGALDSRRRRPLRRSQLPRCPGTPCDSTLDGGVLERALVAQSSWRPRAGGRPLGSSAGNRSGSPPRLCARASLPAPPQSGASDARGPARRCVWIAAARVL